MSTDVYDIHSPLWTVLTSSYGENKKSNEWFTPSRYIEAAREVMGGIDLDPASCKQANRTIKASRYYTEQENGLIQPWYGNIWLNPPFGRQNAPLKGFGGGKSIMGMFVAKLIQEYDAGNVAQAVLLVTNKADTAWFAPLWNHPLCFCTHRVLFNRPNQAKEGHFFGTIFAYLGPNEQKFIDIFSQFGRIAKAIDTPRQAVVPLPLWETH